ncbi:hypothetical protein BCR34DRAFT_89462 [Clohesyomyces aquaticus]|uniref:Uncharacterized protein n=1 Tax=Clohesyomyces aquaticus TaxID=1231657 RepID=A0A1Y1YVV2_9PLEO|nr:hypothetical protein BCR34DRAFT_89462 [Clohesyomyces aquaticus]
MAKIAAFVAVLATLLSTTTALPEDDKHPHPPTPVPSCPCYTATAYIGDEKCPPFKPSKPCIVPMCALLTTTTIPGPNTHCPKSTPTTTSLLPCVTACRTGCEIFTTTETYTSSCLPPSTHSPLPPPRSSLPFTIILPIPTAITDPPPPSTPIIAPPYQPTPPPYPITKRNEPSRSCYTSTVTKPYRCPAEGCIPAECIVRSTTTVPFPWTKSCTATPTVTVPRRCDSNCGVGGGCATKWVTVTEAPWAG